MIDFLAFIEFPLVLGIIFVVVPAFLGTPLAMAAFLLIEAEGDQRVSTRAALAAGTLISLAVVSVSTAHTPANAFEKFVNGFILIAPKTGLVSLRPNWLITAAGVALGWFYLWWIADIVGWLTKRSNLGLPVLFLVPLGSLSLYNYFFFGLFSVPVASLVLGLIGGTLIRLILVPASYKKI
ncbi:MAG: hypothetical protein ACJ75H_00385 [Thermoanaerobaculia bacterium]